MINLETNIQKEIENDPDFQKTFKNYSVLASYFVFGFFLLAYKLSSKNSNLNAFIIIIKTFVLIYSFCVICSYISVNGFNKSFSNNYFPNLLVYLVSFYKSGKSIVLKCIEDSEEELKKNEFYNQVKIN